MTADMPLSSGLRNALVGLVLVSTLGACEKDKLKGPEAEVKKADVKMNLPAVPDFALPSANADGSHSVKEMRVKGKKLLDTEITVKAHLTSTFQRIGVVDRTQAALWAERNGVTPA